MIPLFRKISIGFLILTIGFSILLCVNIPLDNMHDMDMHQTHTVQTGNSHIEHAVQLSLATIPTILILLLGFIAVLLYKIFFEVNLVLLFTKKEITKHLYRSYTFNLYSPRSPPLY